MVQEACNLESTRLPPRRVGLTQARYFSPGWRFSRAYQRLTHFSCPLRDAGLAPWAALKLAVGPWTQIPRCAPRQADEVSRAAMPRRSYTLWGMTRLAPGLRSTWVHRPTFIFPLPHHRTQAPVGGHRSESLHHFPPSFPRFNTVQTLYSRPVPGQLPSHPTFHQGFLGRQCLEATCTL